MENLLENIWKWYCKLYDVVSKMMFNLICPFGPSESISLPLLIFQATFKVILSNNFSAGVPKPTTYIPPIRTKWAIQVYKTIDSCHSTQYDNDMLLRSSFDLLHIVWFTISVISYVLSHYGMHSNER